MGSENAKQASIFPRKKVKYRRPALYASDTFQTAGALMIHSQFSYETSTELTGVAFCALRHMLLKQAKMVRSKVVQDSEGSLLLASSDNHLSLCAPDSGGPVIKIAAKDERILFECKCALLKQLEAKIPKVAAGLDWTSDVAASNLPDNFSFVRLRDVTPLGRAFLRLTLEGEDLSEHRDRSIHFRFVQPPQGKSPSWPTVAPNGSIAWPDDEGAPHKPVYTTRSVDYENNTMEVDVFVHDGGRTTQWAQQFLNGQKDRQIIGLVGPVGGGTFVADKVLMAADETGFPAAARILENLPHDVTGQLFLEAEQGADCGYPFDIPTGIKVTWLNRATDQTLAEATLAVLPQHKGSKIWFAGERQQARQVREAGKATGRDANDLRISGFWAA
jgi:NADPH-dependent ferric siderophore reductase